MPERIRILFIEDNPDDVALLILTLEQAGMDFDWERVQNATELQESLNKPFDIILADYTLPQFSAPEALTILREARPDIPLIVVTGSISEEVAVNCMKMGAYDYLLKDRLPRLASAVQNALIDQRNQQFKREAELALRRSEQRTRTMFQEARDVILIIDSIDGHILDVNEAVRRILMHNPEDLIGKTISVLFKTSEYVSPERILRELRRHDDILISQKILRADQSLCSMDLTTTIIPWDQGSSAIMLTLRDVTEREQRDAEHHAAETLRIELERERDVNDLKTRFITITSHEFRTPLTIISSANQLLDHYRDRITEERRATLHRQIEAQVQYMTTLLEDVLIVGQMQTGNITLNLEEIAFSAYIEALIDELRSTYAERQITLDCPVAETSLILGDKKLLRQMTLNLITNAIKYSATDKKVHIEIKAEAMHVTLRVVDHGIGIPAADQKFLFQTFFRASNVGTINGTGLGLSIVRWAVEMHQGSIHVESKPGVQTVFTVQLPRHIRAKA